MSSSTGSTTTWMTYVSFSLSKFANGLSNSFSSEICKSRALVRCNICKSRYGLSCPLGAILTQTPDLRRKTRRRSHYSWCHRELLLRSPHQLPKTQPPHYSNLYSQQPQDIQYARCLLPSRVIKFIRAIYVPGIRLDLNSFDHVHRDRSGH